MDQLMDFKCPACGAALRAPFMAAGRPGRCTKCQKEFIVPAQFALDAGAAAAPVAAPAGAVARVPSPIIDPFARPAAKPKYKPGLSDALRPLIPGAIALLLLGVGGWFAWSYFSAGDDEARPRPAPEGEAEQEQQRQAAQQAERARQLAADQAAQALAQAAAEKAQREAAAAAAAPPPLAPVVATPAAPPAVTMSKKEAEQLVTGGKIALQEADSDPSRALAAAIAFSRALPYYQAGGDLDLIGDIEADIFWCKKRMTGESVKVLIAQKFGDDAFKAALERVDALATKEVAPSEARAYYDRADKFAAAHPDDFEQIARRYFEIAERFAGSELSARAQKASLLAQQREQKRVQTDSEVKRQTIFTKGAGVAPGKQSAAIPGADAMKAAVVAVRKLYKDDYAKSKPNQKRRLAAKLLEQVPLSKDDPTTQYAMLSEAIELAFAGGDWYAVCNACDLMAQEFAGVEAKAKKKEALAKARSTPVVAALLKLIDVPEDPEANAVAGKYFGLESGRWELALPLLAHGSDAEFKAAAEGELVKPAAAAQQLELADKWYALGKKAKPGARESLLARAFSWYQLAAAASTGITKQRIAARVEEIDGLLPMTNLDYGNLTPKQWDRLKGALVEVSAGKDRNDSGIAIARNQRVRVVPHPTETWTSDYFGNPVTVNWKGYENMRVSSFGLTGLVASDFPIGAVVMQVEQGKLQRPGIIEGVGRIFLGPYAAGWGAGGTGVIHCKLIPVTDDD